VPARHGLKLCRRRTTVQFRRDRRRRTIVPGEQVAETVHFGPKAPQGKELNWIPTSAGAGFEVLFRFYGPEMALFDKIWMLPDIEQIT
jgi:hypothetical protein